MIRRLVLFSAIAGLNLAALQPAAAQRAQQDSGWYRLTGPGGTFSVEMPHKPETKKQALASGRIQQHSYLARYPEMRAIYTVAVYANAYDSSEPKGFLAALAEANGNATLKNGWARTTWTEHAGRLALDAEGRDEQGFVRSYHVLDGTDVIILMWETKLQSDPLGMSGVFFKSLAFRQ